MNEKVTITLTMCRRPHMLRRTLRSFMRCCLDTDLIEEWRAVDDGTHPAVLRKLADEFPFLNITSNPDKGHANALNLIMGKVGTPRIFHLEDDWLFLTPGHFIRAAQDVMASEPSVANVCLRHFRRSEVLTTAAGTRYEHHYSKDENPDAPSFWPGYSLNPSLQDLERIKNAVGSFEPIPRFERNFALRYKEAGLRLCYLHAPADQRWMRHIGNRSAYNLNRTRR